MMKLSNKINSIATIILTSCLLYLAGCGFELRGYHQGKLNIKDININYQKSASLDSNTSNASNNNNLTKKFITSLVNNFNNQNIKALKNTSKYNHTLEFTAINYSKNIISTGSNQLIAQYKLSLNTNFNFYHKDKLLLKDQNIVSIRNYNYTQDQILGLNSEEDAIINDLIQDSINKIILQIMTVTN